MAVYEILNERQIVFKGVKQQRLRCLKSINHKFKILKKADLTKLYFMPDFF